VNTIPAVFVVRKMFKLFVVRIQFGVEYHTCLEFFDNRALKISAIPHFPIESYAISNPVLAAVQRTRRGLGNEIFRAIERRNLIMR
jgi:hypothetical protein